MVDILSLYYAIPSVDRKQFYTQIEKRSFKKGDFLLFDGDVQKELFLVRAGVTHTFLEMKKKRKIIDFSYNNRFCADFKSFTTQTPAKYAIQCLEDCEIESISFQSLQYLFDQASSIERAYRLLLERILSGIIDKSINNEICTINDRFEWVMQKQPELFKLVPHKYIASYINIDTTNFSKLYNKHCSGNHLIWG